MENYGLTMIRPHMDQIPEFSFPWESVFRPAAQMKDTPGLGFGELPNFF